MRSLEVLLTGEWNDEELNDEHIIQSYIYFLNCKLFFFHFRDTLLLESTNLPSPKDEPVCKHSAVTAEPCLPPS